MIRTSETHPLLIDAVDASPGRGLIGITFAPGKHDRHAIGGPWARDLTKDLDVIAAWNAKAVVTLIEPHELLLLAIPDLGTEVQRRGMEWLHLPIRDVCTPGPEFEEHWPAHSKRLRQRLDAGENIVVHCRGGLGRAGMISARLWSSPASSPRRRLSACARRGLVRSRRRGKRNGSGTVRRDLERPRHERFQPRCFQ